jgi:hypothetical protein
VSIATITEARFMCDVCGRAERVADFTYQSHAEAVASIGWHVIAGPLEWRSGSPSERVDVCSRDCAVQYLTKEIDARLVFGMKELVAS